MIHQSFIEVTNNLPFDKVASLENVNTSVSMMNWRRAMPKPRTMAYNATIALTFKRAIFHWQIVGRPCKASCLSNTAIFLSPHIDTIRSKMYGGNFWYWAPRKGALLVFVALALNPRSNFATRCTALRASCIISKSVSLSRTHLAKCVTRQCVAWEKQMGSCLLPMKCRCWFICIDAIAVEKIPAKKCRPRYLQAVGTTW